MKFQIIVQKEIQLPDSHTLLWQTARGDGAFNSPNVQKPQKPNYGKLSSQTLTKSGFLTFWPLTDCNLAQVLWRMSFRYSLALSIVLILSFNKIYWINNNYSLLLLLFSECNLGREGIFTLNLSASSKSFLFCLVVSWRCFFESFTYANMYKRNQSYKYYLLVCDSFHKYREQCFTSVELALNLDFLWNIWNRTVVWMKREQNNRTPRGERNWRWNHEK